MQSSDQAVRLQLDSVRYSRRPSVTTDVQDDVRAICVRSGDQQVVGRIRVDDEIGKIEKAGTGKALGCWLPYVAARVGLR